MIAAVLETFKVRMGVNHIPDNQQLRRERAVYSSLRLIQKQVQNFKNIFRRVEKKN